MSTTSVETDIGRVAASSQELRNCRACGTSIGVDPATRPVSIPNEMPARPPRRYCSPGCARLTGEGFDREGYREFFEVAISEREWPVERLAKAVEPTRETVVRWLKEWDWWTPAEADTTRGGSVTNELSPRGRVAAAIAELFERDRTIVGASDIADELEGLTSHHVGWYLQDISSRDKVYGGIREEYGVDVEAYEPDGEAKTYYLRPAENGGEAGGD